MAQSSTAAGREANLLERSAELAALAEQLEAVTSRAGGRLAFVAGEAGVGKPELVRRFAATLPAAGAGAVTRIKLAALSEAAVAQLAEPYGVDATELYRLTSGNAFYVTEVLAGGTHAVPATVQDAVLARTARLSSAGRTLVEAASIVPAAAELWLLAKMCPEAVGNIDECVASGVLSAQADGVAFRHELARMAVEASLPLNRKSALHSAAMSALADPPQGDRDPARLAHHAEGAGDTRSVLAYASEAGPRASALGAHRESAAHYARDTRASKHASPETLAGLFQARPTRAIYAASSTRHWTRSWRRSITIERWTIAAGPAIRCGRCRGSTAMWAGRRNRWKRRRRRSPFPRRFRREPGLRWPTATFPTST